MDNQQATKGWFVGILEGEGCFISPRDVRGDRSPNPKYQYIQQCQVRISNKEMDLILACKQFLASNSILSTVTTSKRDLHELCINGHIDCRMMYELIKDTMECRLDELEKILGASTTTRETSCGKEWLYGIYEAEGCFTISTQSHQAGNISHKPEIIIETTSDRINSKVSKTLYSLGLAWYVFNRQPKILHYKPSQRLSIVGFKRVCRFLKTMTDGWIGNKTRRKVKLLNEFCNSRLSRGEKEPYTVREHEIACEIKTKI